MPKKGYKTITVNGRFFEKLQEIALKKGLSLPKTLALLILNGVRNVMRDWTDEEFDEFTKALGIHYSKLITSFEEFAKTF